MPTPSSQSTSTYIRWFQDISIQDVGFVGGKNASLGDMYRTLGKKGVHIPNGFAVSAAAYRAMLEKNNLKKKIKIIVKDLDVRDIRALRRAGKRIRGLIEAAPLPHGLSEEITMAYRKLAKETHTARPAVAIRSSATAEDLPIASFAGQQETYLNVSGEKAVIAAVKKALASLFTDRALSYREAHGFDHISIAMSVGVQLMISADTGASGVLFTLDTESGFRGVMRIDASYGLGEYVVKGRVVPDQFLIFTHGLLHGKRAIIGRTLGTKQGKLVSGTTRGTKHMAVSTRDQQRFSISDDDVLTLARWGRMIEAQYGTPQDIEWVKNGKTGRLYIVQARPETVAAQKSGAVIEQFRLKKHGTVLATGIAVGQKIGAGKVRQIDHPRDMHQFKKGEVLVTRLTDPDWEPVMRIASAIVTEQGGKTSHAAIVSRELGIPCLVGVSGACTLFKTGDLVTVSAAEGDSGAVYKGILPFEVKRTALADVPNTKTRVMMNIGDPNNAFSLSFLPHDGVGLARQEFIFSNFIRIHPLALAHYPRLKDKKAKKEIAILTRGYADKRQFAIDKLAEGMGRIAAAMYPKPVVLRLSDFKTNEYASLIGGKEFEPVEANPMLGWRGASRYASPKFVQAFAMECAAIQKARETWGLDNIIVMVPFCRTPEEGQRVLDTMAKFGLVRGKHGLQVQVMCEIPSNVILADEFAKMFDGFSIGSNDLTQLTLGVDRDAPHLAHLFDEENEAIKKMIREVIIVAHKHKRTVGICGQAPSDSPAFIDFLVQAGVDSISLNPDTLVEMRERIAFVEKTVGKTGRRTHRPFLSLVAAIGMVAASIVALGAGCQGIGAYDTVGIPEISSAPAALRAKIQEKLLADFTAAQENALSEITVANFAEFHMSYPVTWMVEQWNGGVTMKRKETGEFISIFLPLIAHPVSADAKTPVTVGGKPALRFDLAGSDASSAVSVVEITMDDGSILEINGKTNRFNELLASFSFLSDTLTATDRPLNHWDVEDGRICVQMITQARPNKDAACQVFSSPCEVPEYWDVCTLENTNL